MKFRIAIEADVANPDVDVMQVFAGALVSNLAGTPIKISQITIMPNEDDPVPKEGEMRIGVHNAG